MKEELRTEDLEQVNGGIGSASENSEPVCPVCKSTNIESEVFTPLIGKPLARNKCLKCGKVWNTKAK